MADETNATLILDLKKLSKIDASIARNKVAQKKLTTDLEQKQKIFLSHKLKFGEVNEEVLKRKSKYLEDENRLKEEREKLVERRKVLATFSDYKVQQSAQREIEQVAKQLGAQEEKILSSVEELEVAETKLKEVEELYKKATEDFQTLKKDFDGEQDALINLGKEKEEERSQVAAKISTSDIGIYNRIVRRHPMDPLVPMKEGKCGGCAMKVAPQMAVLIAKGQGLVKCRGCSRILFMPSELDNVS